MDETERQNTVMEFTCPFSEGAEFDYGLRRARALLHRGEVEEALRLLLRLEQKYVEALELFDLLGEAFLRSGHARSGVRYKTLHEILKGTFKIAEEELELGEEPAPAAGTSSSESGASADISAEADWPSGSVPEAFSLAGIGRSPQPHGKRDRMEEKSQLERRGLEDRYPLTSSMGLELMRQSRYEEAAVVFEKLLAQQPGDHGLRNLRDRAIKKDQARKAVGMLLGWLENLQRLRTGRPASP